MLTAWKHMTRTLLNYTSYRRYLFTKINTGEDNFCQLQQGSNQVRHWKYETLLSDIRMLKDRPGSSFRSQQVQAGHTCNTELDKLLKGCFQGLNCIYLNGSFN
ncbi:hypothetical protein V6Z11_A12G068800 [Gossypium hirsutum]